MGRLPYRPLEISTYLGLGSTTAVAFLATCRSRGRDFMDLVTSHKLLEAVVESGKVVG